MRTFIFGFILFLCVILLSFIMICNSSAMEIVSESLEYFGEEKKIIAIGDVYMSDITFDLKAQKVIYYENTGDIEAYGDLYYNDDEITAWAEEGKLNRDKKTGFLKNALLHIKKQEIWIKASEIERLSEIKYKAKKATFSTCEPEPDTSQPWCFTGEFVDLVIDETLTSKITTFKVKDVPVLFSPVFWGPAGGTKKSGFLPLKFGNSNTRGVRLSPAYYLVIDSNKDATFYLDYFSKIGVGKGIEYRYLDFDTKGMWYGYHIKDKKLNKEFIELRGIHLQKIKGVDFLADLNYVNKNNFYREYGDVRSASNTYLFKEFGKDLSARYDRFLQSSVEVSVPGVQSRFYLLGQGFKDLKEGGISPPLKAELGYVVYPYSIGQFNINFNTSLAEFYKKNGLKGQRFEIGPQISHSMGDSVKLTQSLVLKEIFYNLDKTSPYEDTSHREMIQYNAKSFIRFYKSGQDLTHLIEPFVEGVFVGVNGKPPILKDAEVIDDTALLRTGIFNKLNFRNFSLQARIVQVYDFRAKNGWDKLYPILVEGRVSFWKINFGFDTYQNISKRRIERFNSDISFSPDETTSLSLSERYTRDGSLSPAYIWSTTLRDQYKYKEKEGGVKTYALTIAKKLSERWHFTTNLNYDAKGKELRDSSLNIKYTQSCWAANIAITRRPVEIQGKKTSEFSFLVIFELKGLGPIRVYERSGSS
ncbi:MAG: LPS assembly protein LptD [Thermodesulfovibrio sp.]|nr:LPS assembly protein LptD [Thermodesulfovibrio sp.]MDW7998245.1 LPS assembly protein LptD [Thermodesulfovibrio sp.]